MQLPNDDSVKGELERLQLAIECVSPCDKYCVCSCVKFLFFIGFDSYLFLNRRLKGKELGGMSLSDLISLENQLNESLHNVKDQKVKTKY